MACIPFLSTTSQTYTVLPVHLVRVCLCAVQYAVPGGLIGVGLTVDPTLTRADRLVGQVRRGFRAQQGLGKHGMAPEVRNPVRGGWNGCLYPYCSGVGAVLCEQGSTCPPRLALPATAFHIMRTGWWAPQVCVFQPVNATCAPPCTSSKFFHPLPPVCLMLLASRNANNLKTYRRKREEEGIWFAAVCRV